MVSIRIEEKTLDKYTREGLSILARIIARDFLAKQTLGGDEKNNTLRLWMDG